MASVWNVRGALGPLDLAARLGSVSDGGVAVVRMDRRIGAPCGLMEKWERSAAFPVSPWTCRCAEPV